MANNYIYKFGKSLYLNITNRCPNNCDFCIRRIKDGVSGNELWLEKEPTIEQLKSGLDGYDVAAFDEVVFCGFGEPMCRLDVVLEVGRYLKQRGATVRINTNGLADLINGKAVAPLIKGAVDSVSVSLNASSAEDYMRICHSRFGERAFDAMLAFTRDCVAYGIDATLSVVDVIGAEEVEKCRAIAARTGAKFRVREEITKDTQY